MPESPLKPESIPNPERSVNPASTEFLEAKRKQAEWQAEQRERQAVESSEQPSTGATVLPFETEAERTGHESIPRGINEVALKDAKTKTEAIAAINKILARGDGNPADITEELNDLIEQQDKAG